MAWRAVGIVEKHTVAFLTDFSECTRRGEEKERERERREIQEWTKGEEEPGKEFVVFFFFP